MRFCSSSLEDFSFLLNFNSSQIARTYLSDSQQLFFQMMKKYLLPLNINTSKFSKFIELIAYTLKELFVNITLLF